MLLTPIILFSLLSIRRVADAIEFLFLKLFLDPSEKNYYPPLFRMKSTCRDEDNYELQVVTENKAVWLFGN